MSVVVVIPAYRPDGRLLETLEGLGRAGLDVIVVNDGSGGQSRPVFDRAAAMPHVEVLEHAVNLGKGAALRTGFNRALCRFPGAPGIVTADADGQHTVPDILRVAAALEREPGSLALGARSFRGSVPWRSRIGNQATRLLFRAVHGQPLRDTQTGLRGVPRALAETMLRSTASGYEFELDMLIAARQLAVPFREVEIETVYLAGNASSHFNPLLDSMRIYFLLLRFSLASLLTAVCDNVVFYLALGWSGTPLAAQAAGRLAAVALNFNLNRRMVFLFRGGGAGALARYLGVVAASGFLSYLSLMSLHEKLGWPLLSAKIVVECVLFVANFALLRDFVFAPPGQAGGATDWTAYYRNVPWTARLTRRYTARCLIEGVDRAGLDGAQPKVIEFGGGNSCFLEPLARRLNPASYRVVDTNPLGLDLLRRRVPPGFPLILEQRDVIESDPAPGDLAALVFSVGLVEHFGPEDAARCIAAHFAHAGPAGWVLISFPTPTWLYRVTRGMLEALRLWRFPDERPLERAEVLDSAARYGGLVWEKTLWPLCLTQHMMLFAKTPTGGGVNTSAATRPAPAAPGAPSSRCRSPRPRTDDPGCRSSDDSAS